MQEMLDSFLKALKIKLTVVFLLVHLGLIFSIYGLAEISQSTDIGNAYWFILFGIVGLYGGVLVAAFYIFYPLYSISQKIRWFMNWREWILLELPKMIALIPTIIETLKAAFANPPKPNPKNDSKPDSPTL